MPPRKYTKAKPKFVKKRRTVKPKKYNKMRSEVYVARGANILPSRYIANFKYGVEDVIATGTVGALASAGWRMNSLYDPTVTVGGTFPYGFAELATNYTRYRVNGFSYNIIIAPTISTGNNAPFIFFTAFNGSLAQFTALALTTAQLMDFPHTYYKLLSSTMPTTVKGHFNLCKLNGCKKTEYESDDRFQSSVTTNPVENFTFIISVFSPDGVAKNISSIMRIKYHAELFDPIMLNA